MNTESLLYNIVFGLLLGAIIAAGSYKLKFLSASGSVATAILALIIFGFGGWKYTIPIFMFFFISSILSKVRFEKNREVELNFEKSGTRDFAQVFSNGGAAAAICFVNYFYNSQILYAAYSASIAAVCADTWGTEIGTMFRTKTYNIINLKEVKQGASGGISLPGTAASLAGALFIAAVCVFWISYDIILYFSVIFLAGFLGSIVDSIIGASYQASYICSTCGTITEKLFHCSTAAKHYKGLRWINNDLVNLSAAVSGAIFSIIIFYIFP